MLKSQFLGWCDWEMVAVRCHMGSPQVVGHKLLGDSLGLSCLDGRGLLGG